MSVWEKVFKDPKNKGAAALKPDSLSVEGLKLPRRSHQLPSLFMALALGTTFTKRAVFCQLGSEFIRWKPEMENAYEDLSVFRVEKVASDIDNELSSGEEALGNFLSDRGDPACTLFFQPNRFFLPSTKIPSFVTTSDGNKVLCQSPSNDYIFQQYIKSQYDYLWEVSHKFFSEVRRFQIGQILIETPDYFSDSDTKKYRSWFSQAAESYFPPILNTDEEESLKMKDKIVTMPESLTTVLHWLTDLIEPKLAASELDLKKLLVKHGILPRTTDPINFLVVTMGGTHSRVVRIKVDSIGHLASAKRVGETIPVFYGYLGRTGFGGDHISCHYLEEEEEKRYGATVVTKVNTLSRKVLEDWGKITSPEGKKHFDEVVGEHFDKAIEKLGELTVKGFGESPENTIIVLGGKVFALGHLRARFKNYLRSQRVPQARLVHTSNEETSISRACEILQFHQKGLGRSFTIKSNLDAESGSKLTWVIGKVVEGSLVDTILEPDNKVWDEKNPRKFTITFERGVRRLNLGYQKSAGGLSQLWCNIHLTKRVVAPVKTTFETSGPSDLKIIEVKAEGKKEVVPEDFQVDMLIAGEHPSHYPLYDKVLKTG